MAHNKYMVSAVSKELGIVIALLLCAVFILSAIKPQTAESQGSPGPITGYAWSDTIGWISLSGSGYGLTVDTNGKLSGYAWSDSIGWITSNESELSGCPQNPCRAKIQAGQLTGWLKALSGGTPESGGWDGWISLSGSGYGVTQSNGTLDGYAWGDTVVGWLDFDAATGFQECAETQGYFCEGNTSKHRDAQCVVTTNQVCSYLCAPDTGVCVPAPAPSGNLQVNPTLVIPGQTTLVSWDIDDAVSCTATGTNGDSWSDDGTGSHTSSPIEDTTTYTLVCEGLDDTSFTDTATVSINPAWREL